MPWKTTTYAQGRSSAIADAVGHQTLFAYNADSTVKTKKLLSVVDAAFTRTHDYHYDADGRLDRIETKNAADAVTRVETRGYDPETGRLASVSSPEGTIDYGYDFAGALKSMAYVGREVDYVYDFYGRLSRATAPEGEWNYTYNAAGLKETVTTQPAGGGAELTELWEYDPLGRVKAITHRRAGESLPIFKIEYILGVDGMRIGAVETRGADVVTWTYEYDALNRLTREKRDAAPADGSPHADRNVTYAYDRDSNRVRMDDVLDPTKTRLYEYEPLAVQPPGLPEGAVQTSQRLRQIKDASGNVVETYAWTANGELKTKTAGQTVEAYAWGPAGTLDRYTRTEGSVERARVDYDYDDQGQRIGQRTRQYTGAAPGAPIAYTSDEHRLHLIDRQNLTGYSQSLALVDATTGGVTDAYSILDRVASHSAITNDSASTDHFLISDALGSTRAEAQAPSAPQPNAFDYTAFGEPIGISRPASTLAFTGQWRDATNALQYHRSRWFAPEIGQWRTSDPAYDFPLNEAHSYSYAGSCPTNRSDWSGNGTIVEVALTAAIIGFLVGGIIGGIGGGLKGAIIGAITGAVFGGLFAALITYLGIQVAALIVVKTGVVVSAEFVTLVIGLLCSGIFLKDATDAIGDSEYGTREYYAANISFYVIWIADIIGIASLYYRGPVSTANAHEVRVLYHVREAEIKPKLVEMATQGKGLEEMSKTAHAMRRAARIETRKGMYSTVEVEALRARDRRLYEGDPDGPTWEYLFRKAINKGMTPDQAYQSIIDGSQKTNTIYNKAVLGKDDK